MKGVFGWNASKTYNGWEFNRPPTKLIGEDMSEKSPRLTPRERPLTVDQQRKIGQLSFRDAGVNREYEPPFNVFGVGEWSLDDPRDLADNDDL